MDNIFQLIGMVAAVALPLWNIPLIIRIQKRRSSKDISLAWAFGVLGCLLLMFPAAMASADIIFRVFNIANIALFSLVVIQAVRFR